MSKLSKSEKETIILMSEADDPVSVYTFNRSFKKRLGALSKECPGYYIKVKKKNLAEGAETYLIDKSLCTATFHHPYPQEQREKARERAKKNGFGAK